MPYPYIMQPRIILNPNYIQQMSAFNNKNGINQVPINNFNNNFNLQNQFYPPMLINNNFVARQNQNLRNGQKNKK